MILGELTDLVFSLLGKVGRFLNAKGKRVCFIIWIVCLSYWTVRNYYLGLKVQTIGTFISAMINLYGFFSWGKDKKVKKK